jgi:hypothetical protein
LLAFQHKVQLLDRQRVLRDTLETRQETICKLSERDYRRLQTTVKRYMQSEDRRAQDAHVRCWTERIAAIKDARSALSVKVGFLSLSGGKEKSAQDAHIRRWM